MKIVDLLESEDFNARIVCNDRWLCGNSNGSFTVYEHKHYAKKTTVVLETKDEELAVRALTED